MSDAPDRVWVCTGHNGLVSHSYVTFKPEVAANNIVRGYTVTEMIRADTAEARIRELEEALREIDNLPSHRNPCCPTNPAKNIARRAFNRETTDG